MDDKEDFSSIFVEFFPTVPHHDILCYDYRTGKFWRCEHDELLKYVAETYDLKKIINW